jgi:hypothetical protein
MRRFAPSRRTGGPPGRASLAPDGLRRATVLAPVGGG